MVLTVAGEAGRARLQKLRFPGMDQTFVDPMLTGRFRYPKFAPQHAQDNSFWLYLGIRELG